MMQRIVPKTVTFMRNHYSTSAAVTLAARGATYFPHFATVEEQQQLVSLACKLRSDIHAARVTAGNVPVRTSLSRQHNLTTDEHYKLVHLTDSSSHSGKKKAITGQLFEKYGDAGHELTYFMGTSNVPDFVLQRLAAKCATLVPEFANLVVVHEDQELDWNFTFNAYSTVSSAATTSSSAAPTSSAAGEARVIPGFPFHVDSDFNGDVTAIFSLIRGATVELRPVPVPGGKRGGAEGMGNGVGAGVGAGGCEGAGQEGGVLHRVDMHPGSVLVLSGEARWHWQHRVVPQPEPERASVGEGHAGAAAHGGVRRMSLVLGSRAIRRRTGAGKLQ